MQEQLDVLILDRVADGFFDITVKGSEHNKDIARDYRDRGFMVRYDEDKLNISWFHPDLDAMKVPNKKIYALFTAAQLYNALTKGKDLRRLTNIVAYERLKRQDQIVDTYGMERSAVYNLFSEAIKKAEEKGFDISINDYGVITSTPKNDVNVNEFRPY